MRDDFQFAALAAIAIAIVVGEVVLAWTASSPELLHAALLVVLAGLVGGATFKKDSGSK